MGSPTIFSGKRTKFLTNKGALLSDGSIVDNDGLVNHIKNGHAEINTSGWATYADAAGVTPVNGTGGAPTVTFTRSTASPLAGDASFLLTKDAANRQGEGASYDFTIDSADNISTQNLIIDMSYSTGGTFVTGTSSDLTVYVYDITNATLITPELVYINSANGRFQTTFATVTSSTSYRLIFHVATTSAAAWTFKADRISVRPIESMISASGSNSSIILTTGNGFGSTNTNVRRYSVSTTLGTSLTYTDSATDGGYVTVNEDGIYAMNRLDRNTGAAANFGITKNDVAATGFNNVASGDQLAFTMAGSNLAINACNPGSSLVVGDILRACDDSGAKTNDTTDRTSRFVITKVRDSALPSGFIVATGGTITTDGNYKVHTFNSSGTFQILSGTGVVDSLVVGGGGGGGDSAGTNIGAGGGGGGVIYTSPGSTYGTGSYAITVGAGGTADVVGGTSTFDTINAGGGGYGGKYNAVNGANGVATNGNGGGGGGGAASAGTGGTGNGAGFAGGNGAINGTFAPSGGGGGAGATGQNASAPSTAGNGGNGVANSITGASVTYAGGGGGGVSGGTPGTGGTGGGGNGSATVGGANGTANTGGGGGGSGSTGVGGTGGSGVVILRYQFQ